MRPVATRGLVVTVTRELRPVWDLTADEIFDVWMHFCVRRWLLVAGGPFLLCFPTFSIESVPAYYLYYLLPRAASVPVRFRLLPAVSLFLAFTHTLSSCHLSVVINLRLPCDIRHECTYPIRHPGEQVQTRVYKEMAIV